MRAQGCNSPALFDARAASSWWKARKTCLRRGRRAGANCWATTSVSLLGDAPLPSGCDVTIPVDRGSEESTRLQAEKLARRGHTVRLATPPEDCKDANETLKKHGAAAVVTMLDSAEVLEPPAKAEAQYQDTGWYGRAITGSKGRFCRRSPMPCWRCAKIRRSTACSPSTR